MKIIYEDDYLKVINKPAGVVSALISPLICHRLDQGTSGLLIIAKSQNIKQTIQDQFRHRRIKKEYLTLVSGIISPEKGRIEGYIVRHKKKGFKRRFVRAPEFAVPEEHKRLAISEYKTIKKFEKELFKSASQKSLNYMTYMNVQIFTGRTHQIRAQMAVIHHPIIGDLLYGGKLMRQINQKLDISRQFLHAHQLEFKHPVTGKTIKLESKLPHDLRRVIESLKTLE